MIFAPNAYTLEVMLTAERALRVVDDGELERRYNLKAGSIIEIPDEYAVGTNGNPELALNNWLRAAQSESANPLERSAGYFRFNQSLRDRFYKVKVKVAKAALDSTVPADGEYYIALNNVVRTSESSNQMVVVSDGGKQVTVSAAPKPAVTPKSKTEAVALTCFDCKSTGLEIFDKMRSDLSSALTQAQVQTQRNANRTHLAYEQIKNNFRNNCGFALDEFLPTLKREAELSGVPYEILMSIMMTESSGNCYIKAHESDTTSSNGLFGINTQSSQYRSCSSAERNSMKAMKPVQLASGPQCVENPLINLRESIRILQAKMQIIKNGLSVPDRTKGQRSNVKVSGFDMNQLKGNDLWRLALSAYNGGERYVFDAKRDLELFNQKHGTNLNPNNWEDLRVFYLRNSLNANKQQQYLGYYDSQGRRDLFTSINLAYVENTLGRDVEGYNNVSTLEFFRRRDIAALKK